MNDDVWTPTWPTEPGRYWAHVRWPAGSTELLVVHVKVIASGPLYIADGVFVSPGGDFNRPTFSSCLFHKIQDPPPLPVWYVKATAAIPPNIDDLIQEHLDTR